VANSGEEGKRSWDVRRWSQLPKEKWGEQESLGNMGHEQEEDSGGLR
jgi:hypothetical protein